MAILSVELVEPLDVQWRVFIDIKVGFVELMVWISDFRLHADDKTKEISLFTQIGKATSRHSSRCHVSLRDQIVRQPVESTSVGVANPTTQDKAIALVAG